jgi:hypothetical protein
MSTSINNKIKMDLRKVIFEKHLRIHLPVLFTPPDPAIEAFDHVFVFVHDYLAADLGCRGELACLSGPLVRQQLKAFDGFPVAEALVFSSIAACIIFLTSGDLMILIMIAHLYAM